MYLNQTVLFSGEKYVVIAFLKEENIAKLAKLNVEGEVLETKLIKDGIEVAADKLANFWTK